MKRKALIIGNNIGCGATIFLSGVDHDLKNYYNYLTSDVGGAWDGYPNTEIEILQNKGKKAIVSAIQNCYADFSFVVFTGHGFIDSKDKLTHICVADGYLSEYDLNTSTPKQTLILDCCREIENLSESFLGDGGRISKSRDSIRIFSHERKILNAREKFDFALSNSNNGSFIGYACLIDQTSSDNPTSGGAFSSALLKTGKNFGSRDRQNAWLPVRQAVKDTIQTLKDDILTDQIPTFRTNPKMELTHPFAITNKLKLYDQ